MFKRNLQFVRKNLYIPKVNREKFRINLNKNNLSNLHNIQQYRYFCTFPSGGPNGSNDPEFLLIFILAAASYYIIKKL